MITIGLGLDVLVGRQHYNLIFVGTHIATAVDLKDLSTSVMAIRQSRDSRGGVKLPSGQLIGLLFDILRTRTVFKPLRIQTRRLFVVSILIMTMPWPIAGIRWLWISIELKANRLANPDAFLWARADSAEVLEIAGAVSVCGLVLFCVILFFVILARLWGSSEDYKKNP